MPVSFLSPAQRDSYGQYLGDPSTQELARYFHLDDSDHTQIVEKRGDANRLGFALQLTTVRFVGTFLDDPTAVPPAVLATMSRQLGIDTTTDLTGYRDGTTPCPSHASLRLCSPPSRRIATLCPRSAGLTALTAAPRRPAPVPGRQGLNMTSTSGSLPLPAEDHRHDPLEAAG